MSSLQAGLAGWKPYIIISVTVLVSSVIVLLPFLANLTSLWAIQFGETGMQAVYRYWDGPLYVIVSKTFYGAESAYYAACGWGGGYFSAHLPFYPFTILALSFLGEFQAMIVSTVLFSILSACIFYKITSEFRIAEYPLLLTLFFCFFPLRWFLYKNVGASEPAFLFLCLTTIYFLKKDKLEYSVLFASLATLTRIFGVLLFPVVLLSLVVKKQLNLKSFLISLVIPASFLLLFTYYHFSLGNFYAYFAVNESTLHEPFYVLGTFISSHFGELYAILVIAYALAAITLWEKGEREMSLFIAVYLTFITLVSHGDASRYMLPMAPFAIMAFENVFPKNKIAFFCIILLAAILSTIYAWTMIPTNLMPLDMFERIVATIASGGS
ncbi:MAG: hypothetical protein LUQ01_00610 [Methanolinea sp.]|nr:hypothetical protein [Methanolinea sp.]